MNDLKDKLQEDRAMRDAAKQLVSNDISNLRGDLQEKGLASRFATRMKEGAEGVFEESTSFVKQNPRQVGSSAALGLGLLLAWIFRKPLAKFIDELVQRHWDEMRNTEQPETTNTMEVEAESAPSSTPQYKDGVPHE